MDAETFLRGVAPFDALDPAALHRLATAVQVEFFPEGTRILDPATGPAAFLYVVRAGVVEYRDGDRVLDVAGEGEVFGYLSLLSGQAASATVLAHEDTICLLVPEESAREALGTPRGLTFLGRGLRERVTRVRGSGPEDEGSLPGATVGSLIRRPAVTTEPAVSVGEAAKLMARERVSCLLVPSTKGLGIVTDRDLRSRVLAAGRGAETPVAEVMTLPASTVPPEATAPEVLAQMLENGHHHFPVVDGSGALLGVVTDTDLMGLARRSPFLLRSTIERAATAEEAATAARTLPETVAALVDSSADPVAVGHVVGVTIDTLTRRLLDLAIVELGQPPAPWAWLALGSEARHEQALATDQDHAIAYDAGSRPDDEVDEPFAAIAKRVTDGLEAAGIPRCHGDAMAENRALRRSVAGWRRAFAEWMSDPGTQGSIYSSIVFDYRRLTGPLDVVPSFDEVVATAPTRYPQFLRHLARRALDAEPPTGFFRDFVVESKGEHAGRLDVKHRGILLITNLARAYAVRAGRTEKRTLDRLHGAVASGQLSAESAAALEDAFRLLWQTRLEHQVAQWRAGKPPDDFVDPSAIGPIARRGLKEAFRIIAREQRSLATDLGVSP